MVTPPPSTDPGIVFPICPGSGGGRGGEEHHSKIPRVFKNPKIQKKPTQVSDFWKLEEFAQNPKKPKIPRVSKIQKSKNPNPSFGFLETRGICSKSKKNPKFLEFPKIQKSKNPKPSFGFWKLEEFAQNPKKPKIPRVSKNPKIQKSQPQFRIFGNSRTLLKIQEFWVFLDFEQIPRVSKNPKLGLGFLDFWNFGNSRNFGFFGF